MLTISQHLELLLKWHPIRADNVSVMGDDLNSVLILLTRENTLLQSAFDYGIESSFSASSARLLYFYSPIGARM